MARPMATRWRWPPESWRGIAVQQLLEAEDLGGPLHLPLHDRRRRLGELQGERHVVEHGHVRIERVVLEHHGDVAVLRRHAC